MSEFVCESVCVCVFQCACVYVYAWVFVVVWVPLFVCVYWPVCVVEILFVHYNILNMYFSENCLDLASTPAVFFREMERFHIAT